MGILFHVTYAATVYTQAVMKQWKQDLFCRPSLALNDIKSRWSPHFKSHCTTMASACVSHLLSHCHPCRSGNYCALDSWGARSIRGIITLRHTLGGACLLCDLSDLCSVGVWWKAWATPSSRQRLEAAMDCCLLAGIKTKVRTRRGCVPTSGITHGEHMYRCSIW